MLLMVTLFDSMQSVALVVRAGRLKMVFGISVMLRHNAGVKAGIGECSLKVLLTSICMAVLLTVILGTVVVGARSKLGLVLLRMTGSVV